METNILFVLLLLPWAEAATLSLSHLPEDFCITL